MNFVKYQHIQKLGTPDVEGILVGLCYLTYKIDGANGCLFLGDDGKVAAGGRARVLSDFCLIGIRDVHNHAAFKHFRKAYFCPPRRLLVFRHCQATFS